MQRSDLYGLESLDSVRGQQLFDLVAESTSEHGPDTLLSFRAVAISDVFQIMIIKYICWKVSANMRPHVVLLDSGTGLHIRFYFRDRRKQWES